MKGIVLAGGTGLRIKSLTRATNVYLVYLLPYVAKDETEGEKQ